MRAAHFVGGDRSARRDRFDFVERQVIDVLSFDKNGSRRDS
jgi:hypothetical protein